jgi:DNA-binding NarL/FixJ family response regulator
MGDEQSPAQLFAELTARQREVAYLLAEGLTRAEIAQRLCISINTAHEHERHVYETLGCHCRSQVAAFVLRLVRDVPPPK